MFKTLSTSLVFIVSITSLVAQASEKTLAYTSDTKCSIKRIVAIPVSSNSIQFGTCDQLDNCSGFSDVYSSKDLDRIVYYRSNQRVGDLMKLTAVGSVTLTLAGFAWPLGVTGLGGQLVYMVDRVTENRSFGSDVAATAILAFRSSEAAAIVDVDARENRCGGQYDNCRQSCYLDTAMPAMKKALSDYALWQRRSTKSVNLIPSQGD